MSHLYPVASLEGALLDAAVAKVEGLTWALRKDPDTARMTCFIERQGGAWTRWEPYNPSWSLELGGPIIEREKITSDWHGDWWCYWRAKKIGMRGPTHLVAAMRAYVAGKFNPTVEL